MFYFACSNCVHARARDGTKRSDITYTRISRVGAPGRRHLMAVQFERDQCAIQRMTMHMKSVLRRHLGAGIRGLGLALSFFKAQPTFSHLVSAISDPHLATNSTPRRKPLEPKKVSLSLEADAVDATVITTSLDCLDETYLARVLVSATRRVGYHASTHETRLQDTPSLVVSNLAFLDRSGFVATSSASMTRLDTHRGSAAPDSAAAKRSSGGARPDCTKSGCYRLVAVFDCHPLDPCPGRCTT